LFTQNAQKQYGMWYEEFYTMHFRGKACSLSVMHRNFNLQGGLGVDFIECKGKLCKQGVLISITLYD